MNLIKLYTTVTVTSKLQGTVLVQNVTNRGAVQLDSWIDLLHV